ncbi:MAG: sulfatase [Kiritimatiellaeota bacterium]|nr:sulfatase [Kiritimatiellota bacterium]
MQRRHATGRRVALAVAAAVAMGSMASGADKRPNILFMMSDDHAAHAISAYNGKLIQTPNLDRLAKEGMRFERVYCVNSICTPSRATILTGQYSHVNGVPVFNAIDPARVTVAKLLQNAGYYTAMIGKWHLGSDPAGFDHWEVYPGQGVYHDPVLYTKEGSKKYDGEYCTELEARLAIETLRARPKDKPFFMMLHRKAPHRPWNPSKRLDAIWRQKTIPEPDTLFDDYATRTDAIREQTQSIARHLTKTDVKDDPPEGLAGDALTRWKYQRYMQDYLACIQSIDETTGDVLKALEDEGILDDTVIIYTSDQGFFLGDHGMYDKRFMYEESLKMPFLVRWGKNIKPGSVNADICINCDFAPTFLELAGAPVPADMQGASMLPLLGGKAPPDWRTSMYYRYYHSPGDHNTARHYGVRTLTHKLIHFDGKGQWELYDLVNDPAELRNIYNDPAAQPTVKALKAELARLQKFYGDTEDLYADPKTWPKASSYVNPPPRR